MIEPAFRLILANDDTVSSMVSAEDDPAIRIWFNFRPQDERRTGIVLQLVSSVPEYTFEGRAGYVNGRMQVNCLSSTYSAAKALAAAVRNALDGYNGTQDGTVICYIESDNIRDLPALPLQGAGVPATFGVSVDARFMVKE